jgi:hypothetical protein
MGNSTCFQVGIGYYAENGIRKSCNYNNDEFCPNKGMTKSDIRLAGAGAYPSVCNTDYSGCTCASDSTSSWCSDRVRDLNFCPPEFFFSNPTSTCKTNTDQFGYYTKAY